MESGALVYAVILAGIATSEEKIFLVKKKKIVILEKTEQNSVE